MVYLAADPLSGVLSILHFINLGGKKEKERKGQISQMLLPQNGEMLGIRYVGVIQLVFLFSPTSKNYTKELLLH